MSDSAGETPYDFTSIKYFQFDNLVQNRVPFSLFTIGADLKGWYKSIFAMHLENVTVACESAEQVLQEIEDRKIPVHEAIVLLCADGKISKEIGNKLEAKGFTNYFVVDGGLAGMKKERG